MSEVIADAAVGLGRRIALPIAIELGRMFADSAKDVLSEAFKGATRYGVNEAIGDRIAQMAVDVIRSSIFYRPKFVADAPNPGYLIDYGELEVLLDKAFKATVLAASVVGEDASEVILEIVQEGITQAIMYGLGGSLALTAAYTYGFNPHSIPFQQYEDYLSPRTRSNIDLSAGNWAYYTAAVEFMRIAGEFETLASSPSVRGVYEAGSVASAPFTVALSELSTEYRNVVSALVRTIEEYLAVLARRANDVYWALEAAKLDYENGVITEAEYNMVLLVLNDQLDAIEEVLNRLGDIVDGMWSYVDNTAIQDALNNVRTAIDNLHNRIRDSWWASAKNRFSEYWDTVRRARDQTNANMDVELSYHDDSQTFTWETQAGG